MTKKQNILIAGGAGYIGAHTNKMLANAGFETVVLDNLSAGYEEFVNWGSFFKGNIGNISDLRSCFQKYNISAVMHFCAFANVGESVLKPDKYYQNNVVNTLNLLNVMREFNIKHFIFSSTCATYGEPQFLPFTEDHPQIPINPYGKTKLMVEKILEDYDIAYGIKHINLRYFNAAGADPDADIGERHKPETHLIPLVLQAILGQRPDIKIFGTDYDTRDGTCVRDYIHVNDLAAAHILALKYLCDENKSDSFNLGNGQGFTVMEVIEMAEKVAGKKCIAIESERRAGDPDSLIGSSEKAKKLLGWQPQYADLKTIIETAWQWHQKENK